MSEMNRRTRAQMNRRSDGGNGSSRQTDYAQQTALAVQGTAGGQGQDEDVIDLVELFWELVSKMHIIIIAAIIGALIAGVYAFVFYRPQYKATAKLYILSNTDSVVNLADLQIGNALGPDYTEVFKTWEVSEMVRQEMKMEETYTEIQKMVAVSIPSSSRVIYLTATHTDPQMAADLANAYANAGKRFIMETMNTLEPNIFSYALVPNLPSSRGKAFYIAMGFIIGSVLAAGIIIMVHLMDNRPRTAEDVAKYTGLPILTVIPIESGSQKKKKQRELPGRE